MEAMQALKHVRTLTDVASQTDDIDTVHRLLGEIRGVVNNVLPVRQPRTKVTAARDRELGKTIVLLHRQLK